MRDRLALHGVRLHDLRHSHATQMLKQNIHPKVVQERLGHSSISLTLDTYRHVAPGLQKAAAEKFDEVMKTWREKEADERMG
jgi:integrase